MATQPDDGENTGRLGNPLAPYREGPELGQGNLTEAGDTAEEPGTGEEAAEEESSEPMICAICNDPIDGTPLMAAYGPVHDPGCSSQTKRVP